MVDIMNDIVICVNDIVMIINDIVSCVNDTVICIPTQFFSVIFEKHWFEKQEKNEKQSQNKFEGK